MSVVLINPKATQSAGSITVTEIDGSPVANDISTLKLTNGTVTDNADGSVTLTVGTGVGNGDMSGPAASIDGEVPLFSGTGGKTLKRSNLTGVLKSAAGVLQVATAGTDYLTPPSGAALLKANGGSALANATPGVDYLVPTMTTLGDTVYGGVAGVNTRLSGSTKSSTRYLTQTGTGSASAAPKWGSLPLTSNIWYYMHDEASDVNGHKTMLSAPTELVPITLEVTNVAGTGVTLANWITELGFPAVQYIPAGPRELHIHAHKLSGTNSTVIYGEFWEVSASGVDIQLIATTEISEPLGATETEYLLYADASDTIVTQSVDSRFAIRIKANSTGGTAATVHIQYGGTSDSHIAVPRNMVDAHTFIPYAGATKNVNLGNNSLSMAGAVSITLGGSQQIHVDATTPRLVNKGVFRIEHVAGIDGTRPLYLDIDAAGFGNTHAVAIDFITGAMAPTDSSHIYSVNVDGSLATGGAVHGFSVDVLAEGALSNVYAIAANTGVAPLIQWVGTWAQSSKAFALAAGSGTYTDITTGTHTIFAAINDYIYVAADAQFTQVRIPMSVVATSSILPVFEYWNGSAWTTFTPLDNSSGFSDNGTITWSDTPLSGWATTTVHGFTKYWIRVKRTEGTSAITELSVQTADPISYSWTKLGELNTKSITAETFTSSVSTGTSPFTVTSTTEVANLRAAKATILSTARSIYGNNFDGSTALTQIIASTYGGTGNGFTKFSGPTTAERTFTLPDSNATLLYSGGALGTPSSGNLSSCSFPTLNQNTTGTAAIATNTTITEDTATATAVYPTWVTANTGNLPQKTTSTKLSFVPSTGILTATGFAGPLTGNVTGNVSGTAATVTGAAQTSITSLGTLTGLTLGAAAKLEIGAGSNTIPPVKLTSGTNLTSVQSGAMEFDGNKLYFTPSTVRNTIVMTPVLDAPVTATSGFGTSPTVTSTGVRATRIICGAAPGTNIGVIGLPTAPTGWIVTVVNMTAGGVGKTMQTGFTVNSATFAQFANNNNTLNFAQNDVILITAHAF